MILQDPVTPADAAAQLMEMIRYAAGTIEKAFVGRRVRVLSNHNGQPYGCSHKSWKDEVCIIKSVHVDVYNGISLCLKGHEYGECYIPAYEVSFL